MNAFYRYILKKWIKKHVQQHYAQVILSDAELSIMRPEHRESVMNHAIEDLKWKIVNELFRNGRIVLERTNAPEYRGQRIRMSVKTLL